jgi:hypothetical protein
LPFGCFDNSEYATSTELVNLLYAGDSTFLNSNSYLKTNNFSLLTELNQISDVRYGVLVTLALSSLTVYGLIIAG